MVGPDKLRRGLSDPSCKCAVMCARENSRRARRTSPCNYGLRDTAKVPLPGP
jgi:hypothetical protein